jgi:formate dehydrogenase subunit delta
MAWSPMSSPDDTSHGIDDKLVYMANQIGKFFKAQNMDTAAAKIAEHITKFWDPRMRQAIVAHLDAGGAGLDPTTRRAVETVRQRSQAQPGLDGRGKPIADRTMSGRNKLYPSVKASKNRGDIAYATHPCSGTRFQGKLPPALFGR